MPKGAGENDPRPVVVTTHGYLNTKEMQDAPAIEMSRRGYIVLALDMYDHGDSRWAQPIPSGGHFSTFWVWAQFDAAQYMAAQPYTLKNDEGNAYLAVSGHSMGGFSSFVAVYMDEMASLQTGVRSIYAAIPAGADLSYASMIAPRDQLLAAFGDRTIGVIAAHYDEFFFNKSAQEKTEEEAKVSGTIVYKDYPATAAGKVFLGLPEDGPAGEAGQYYTAESGALVVEDNTLRESQTGERVVFTPSETHPWNHFSGESTADFISFYTHVFEGVIPAGQTNADLPPSNQVWQWKEAFNFLALIGFFLLFVPLVQLLLRLPFLNKAAAPDAPALPTERAAIGKWIVLLGAVLGTAIPAIFYAAFMDKQSSLNILGWIAAAVGAAALVVGFIKREAYLKGGIVTAATAAILALCLFFADRILPLGRIFNEPTVNQIGYWALCSGLLTALITVALYYFLKKPGGAVFRGYAIPGVLPAAAAFVTALLAVALGYAVLFLAQALFGVDFRIWTLAVRTLQMEHVWTALRYLPFFFVYYFFNATAIHANAGGKRAGTLLAILMNAGGLAIWLLLQYGLLFGRGTAMQPGQALNGILLFALTPCLAVAAVYARKLAARTNNIWLPAFLNAFLFTMITCANTAMFWNLA
jgi:dienelactone hydrolase